MSDPDAAAAGDGRESVPGRWAKPGLVTIRCRANGPYVIEVPDEPSMTGEPATPSIRVIDHEGGEFPLPTGKRAVALCRCGQSGRRPWCDGSHRAAGFQAEDRAGGGS